MRFRRFIMLMMSVVMMSLSIYTPVFAEGVNTDDSDGIVTKIVIPDEKGQLIFYSGEEAQHIYNQLEKMTMFENDNIEDTNRMVVPNGEIVPMGVHYRHRFVTNSKGTKYGRTRRITQYLINQSSTEQSMKVSASTNVKWSINADLSGKFQDVFEATVGSDWEQSVGFSQEITINVPDETRMWLEYKPLMRYISGESQKYFIPRGPVSKKPIIVKKQSVYSTSPKKIIINLGGKRFTAPDGAYIWKEDKNIYK